MRKVVALYEKLLDRCSKQERPSILATYALFNALIPSEDRSPNWGRLEPLLEQALAVRTIESMSLEASLDADLGGELGACVEAYEAFAKMRFSRMMLQLPRLTEVKVLAAIANKAGVAGNAEIRKQFLDFAIGEAAGQADVQAALLSARTTGAPVDLKAIFSLKKSGERRQHEPPPGMSAVTATDMAGSDEG